MMIPRRARRDAAFASVAFAILTALALLFGVPCDAQGPPIDLRVVYGLTPPDGDKTVGDKMTAAEARAKYSRAAARCDCPGTPDLTSLSAYDAAYLDAAMGGQSMEYGTCGPLVTNVDIIAPNGYYLATIPTALGRGSYTGAGSGYTDRNGGDGNHSTVIAAWHERWNGDPGRRNIFESGIYGRTDLYAYAEGLNLSGFRIDGRQSLFPDQVFEGSGVVLWRTGECARMDDIFSTRNRTDGFQIHGAIPLHVGTVSAFDNVKGGFVVYGGWGSNLAVGMLSGDDNAYLFASLPGPLGEGGGSGTVAFKHEECQSPGRSYRHGAVAYLTGQFAFTFTSGQTASDNCRRDAAFIVDPVLTNGSRQGSLLNVTSLKGWGYDFAVHDVSTGRAYRSPGDYQSATFTYHANGTFTSTPTLSEVQLCSRWRSPTNVGSLTACDPYRFVLRGPPAFPSTVYLDDQTDPGPVACDSWDVGPWSPCTNGTRTRTVTASPAGCEGTPSTPRPAESESCDAPPPVAGVIDPTAVDVVVNTDDPSSEAMAAAYCAAWGIPTTNIVRHALGDSEDLTSRASLDGLRSKLRREFAALAFARPHRYRGAMGITSAVTFGDRSVSSLTVNPVYQYTGTTPRTDVGVEPSFLLRSDRYIRASAHATSPSGEGIVLLAKDGGGPNPRGDARADQRPSGVTVWDSRNDNRVGPGEHPCNNIDAACSIPERTPIPPVVAYYGSMYKLTERGSEPWRPGFYADHVTSFGGALDGYGGQTPVTFHLDNGAGFAHGTVSEPWQDRAGNSPGSLVEQFVDIRIHWPLYKAGAPHVVSAWASVKSVDRGLFVGDGLCAPYATGTPPPPVACSTWDVGPWSACADGVQTRTVTPAPSGCTGTPPGVRPPTSQTCTTEPPSGSVIWSTTFATVGACDIVATVGQNLSPQFGCPKIEGGRYYARVGGGYNEAFPCDIKGATRIVLEGYDQPGPAAYQYLFRGVGADGLPADVRQLPDGRYFIDRATDVFIDATVVGDDLVIDLPFPVNVTSLFGPNPWVWSADACRIE